jgi:hypothetical protein
MGLKFAAIVTLAFTGFALAESVPTANALIPPESGWVGTTILGSVLYWLLWHHLPAKDKQLKEKDEQIERAITAHMVNESETRDAFIRALKEEAATHASERDKDYERFSELLQLPFPRSTLEFTAIQAAGEAVKNAAAQAHNAKGS